MKRAMIVIVLTALAVGGYAFSQSTATSGTAVSTAPAASCPQAHDPKRSQRKFTDLREEDPIINDVYVRLYRTRLAREKSTLVGLRSVLQNRLQVRQRTERLYYSNAVSAEETEKARADVEVAAAAVQEAQDMIAEAEVMLDIAVDRISLGLDMPICAQLR